jgi:hypothetical protein
LRLSITGSLSCFIVIIIFSQRKKKNQKKKKESMSDRRVAAWCQGFCDIFLYNKKCLGNTSKNIAKPIGLDLETIFWGGFERTRLSLLYFLFFQKILNQRQVDSR